MKHNIIITYKPTIGSSKIIFYEKSLVIVNSRLINIKTNFLREGKVNSCFKLFQKY